MLATYKNMDNMYIKNVIYIYSPYMTKWATSRFNGEYIHIFSNNDPG